jgi:hypothetical protein
MGIKRILVVAVIVVAVLGLSVLLLFQSGVDEKVIDSLLPKVEKRLGVKIIYSDVDASLTSLSLDKVRIIDPGNQCVLASVERFGIGFRVGPLFVGKVDLTGIRLEGLEIRYGKEADGCSADSWKRVARAMRAESTSTAGGSKDRILGRPEVYVVSGRVVYNDGRFSAELNKISGRADDKLKSAFEVESWLVVNRDALKIRGLGMEIQYQPDEKEIVLRLNSQTIEVWNPKEKALAVLRDVRQSLTEWAKEAPPSQGAKSSSSNDEGSTEGDKTVFELPNLPAIDIAASIADAKLIVRDSTNKDARWVVDDIAWDFRLNEQGLLTARAAGRLPGTNARFNFNLKKAKKSLPELFLKIPDMPLASLGAVLFPSPHVDWSAASMDGDLHLTFEKSLDMPTVEGQAVFSNLSISHDRIASEPIVGLSFSTDFKMRFDRKDESLNIERLLVSRNLFRFTIRGNIWLDRLAFDLNLNVPSTACKQVAQGIPDPLKSRLMNTQFDGTLSADFHFSVDEAAPDNVVLDPNVDNQCRIVGFGDMPNPSYFKGPFAYIAYTENDEPLRLVTGPGTERWTSYGEISPFLIEAVLTTEDGKFWSHKGITIPEIKRAIELNLRAKNMSHGASTITMQLAKNLFLGRERTIARKLQELVFVWYLETHFSKEELLELYFNIVEFGPSLYGISDAAIHYFGRTPSELNELESVFLIKLLPNPVERHKTYEAGAVSAKQMSALQRVLKTMHDRNRLTDAEYTAALGEQIVFHREGEPFPAPREAAYHQLKGRASADDTGVEIIDEDDGQSF